MSRDSTRRPRSRRSGPRAPRALGACLALAAALAAASLPARGQGQTPVLPEGLPGKLIESKPLTPVPGTRVSLAPPPGFAPSSRFPGFHRPDAAASIIVAEFPAPAESVAVAMSEAALRQQGMTLLSSSRAVAGGVLGTLYSVREEVGGRAYRKWIALFGNERESVLLTASFPESLADQLAEPLKTSLLGSGWSPHAQVDQQAGLPFRLDEGASLRVLQRAGNMVVLGDPARRPRPASRDPMLVAGVSPAERDMDDMAAFAERRARLLDRVEGLRDVQGVEVEVDGRAAWELTATADDIYGGGAMLVYQLLVPDERQYLLVQALVGVEEESLWLPRFRATARSARRVE